MYAVDQYGQLTVRSLVTEPLQNFRKLTGKDGSLSRHDTNDYHKAAVCAAEDFCKAMRNPAIAIDKKPDTTKQKNVGENRARLRPIIEAVLLFGKQNIAFRGHRDDGRLDLSNPCVQNQGNFREILKYRAAGDPVLADHLTNSKGNATYISKSIKNEIISIIGDYIRGKILHKIRNAEVFSIIFDETTDLAKIEQMSIVVRYVDETNSIREDFLGFQDCFKSLQEQNVQENSELSLTGENLGLLVVKAITSLGLSMKNVVGIGTDGAAVMSSLTCGAARKNSRIRWNGNSFHLCEPQSEFNIGCWL